MTDDLDDNAMQELLKELPRSIEPPRDLYPAIGARIAAKGAERRKRRVTVWLALAASVGLVVTSSLITSRVIRSRARPPVAAVPLPADARVLEAGFVVAAQDLERVLARERAQLSPATVKVIERNLDIIDRAIRESRDALARDPGNREAARLLWATYRQKLDLLQRATRLGPAS